MAESDTILQLGIEAAREGNREEARNLFSLLTRQDPQNIQGWLWLAGVAETTDQRREALQKVITLDPTNEMAVKGLQALGAAPEAEQAIEEPELVAAVAPPIEVAAPVAAPPEEARPAAPQRQMSDDELYALELDSAFDDYDAVPVAAKSRMDAAPEDEAAGVPALVGDGASAASLPPVERPRSSSSSGALPPMKGDSRSQRRRQAAARLEEEEEAAPVRRGPSPLLWALLGAIALVVIIFLALRFLAPPQGQPIVVTRPTPATEATPEPGQPTEPGQATPEPGQPVEPGQATPEPGAATPEPGQPVEPGQPTPAPEQPTAAPPTGPLDQANPAPVEIGSSLQAAGWEYSYPNANYAVVLGKDIRGFTAQGVYVHVLAHAANSTGAPAAIPADFFVLKDAQGRVYQAVPQVSNALVVRGVNADVGMDDAIPADGQVRSIYLVFDVQPGATNLVLFSSANTAQGWPVLNAVP